MSDCILVINHNFTISIKMGSRVLFIVGLAYESYTMLHFICREIIGNEISMREQKRQSVYSAFFCFINSIISRLISAVLIFESELHLQLPFLQSTCRLPDWKHSM